MEIREDFKVDFDSWKKEAKLLCRKSIFFIFLFSFFLPAVVYFLMEKFQIAAPNLNAIHYPLASAALLFFSMFSSFYTLFYFKRVDFGEPKNILNMFRDIIHTYKNFIEYVKIHIVFFYMIGILTVLTVFLGFFITVPYTPRTELHIISSSLVGAYISFYLFLSASHSHLFGIVYIGYGMVNKEGALILTTNAFNKYPELRKYVFDTSFKFSIAYMACWLMMILSDNKIISIALSGSFIIVSSYHVAIYYLISRDLYGGKKQTQKVTEKVEDINAVPMPL